MSNKTKKIISLFIILIAIFVSWKIINKKTNAKPNIESKKSNNLNLNFTPPINLTQEFLKQNSLKISSQKEKLNYIDIYNNIEKIIDLEDKENEITKKDIKILESNNKENDFLYIYLIQQIVKTKMEQINNLNQNDFDTLEKYFKKIYDILNETIIILKNINVPNYFLEDHLKLLNFFNKHKNIYKSFSSPKDDPLRYFINSYKIIDLNNPLEEYQKIFETMLKKLEKKYEN